MLGGIFCSSFAADKTAEMTRFAIRRGVFCVALFSAALILPWVVRAAARASTLALYVCRLLA